ncbi:uncharacterized protein LY89DRAFT_773274 [Mollisia scopiformis]|uniref:Heterokaryon incompatibility domain-containing protein n=1 Tax=Mollisia scopiformis TaxID=149040 RepID=A0A194XG51_MOLSC|nr:uncharacterized protein LY89DRAFT_773274 [Mollisia scopiformis]KUJ19175.1 hypothetical protein LY89DRAFT_773274 [Mollisia scopiformis]
MRSIYSKAKGVFISLGEAAEDSRLVPSLAETLVAWEDDSQGPIEQIINPRRKNEFCALQALLTRTYWTRVWVVQEVNSAKEAHILCGEDLLPWETLLRAQNIVNLNQSALWKLVKDDPRLASFTSDVWYEGPRGLLSHIGNEEPSLFEALRWHCTKESTLPEDKVYAILGITTAKEDPAMVIDYSRGVEQLYIDTTKYIIQSTRRLDVICGMQRPHHLKSAMELPSWVVNWVDAYTSCLLDGSTGEVEATGSREASFEFSKDGRMVTVEGIHLGTISSVAEFPVSENENIPEEREPSCLDRFCLSSLMLGNPQEATIPDLLRLCKSFTCSRILRDVEILAELSDADATRMILAVFAYLAIQENTMIVGPPMADLAQELTERYSEQDLDSWSEIILSDLETILHSRDSFICSDGLLGSGFGQIEAGCEVFAILGCAAAVILLPTGINIDGIESFKVIGDSYLDGYMLGEALVKLDQQKLKLKKLVLV